MKYFFQTVFTTLLFALLFTNCQQDDTALDELVVEQQPTEPAQSLRKCATDDVYRQMLENEPGFRENRLKIEQFTQEYLASNPLTDRAVVSIPVVVHVLWKTSAQNISDAQIQSQINALNQDFRRLNADAANTPAPFQTLAADAEVEFCLATLTPSGAATNGIERRQTTVTSFRTNDNMKRYSNGGLDAWDASQYLNIWVCNLSGGILGYAQFPGGSPATDGVVVTYTAFGTTGTAQAPFNLGRTATHEVGHWLNLYHIWGDDGTSCSGSDEVADTPNQGSENYACPAFPHSSCSNGPNGDMFMNYMDYTDDGCMNIYTLGQKNRMKSLFATNGPRYGLLSSNGCNAPGGGGGTCAAPTGLSATNITTSSATVNWGAVSGANSYNLQYKPSNSTSWTTIGNISATSRSLTGLSASTGYDFKVLSNCTSGSSAYSTSASFTTLAGGGTACTDNYEPNNSRNQTKLISVNTDVIAKIGAANDADWFRFSNSLTAKNIRISLTNLPADYDVYLYRNNTLVGYSENPGTDSEEIIYNSNSVTTYKIEVVGWDGAFSASQCYTLRADIRNTAFRITGNNQRVSKKK